MICIITTMALFQLSAPPAPGPFAPTPYTAEEIRAASPRGRTVRHRVTLGRKTTVTTMEFGEVTETGCQLTSRIFDASGKSLLEKPSEGSYSWEDLRRHARFARSETTITDAAVEVPAGRFECKLYTVERKEAGKSLVSRYWFARTLAGPPVKMTVESSGRTLRTMELLAAVPSCAAEARVHFEYDAMTLSPADVEPLRALAACISARGRAVIIEGHTEQRRTAEYNMALGARYAMAVKKVLVASGVDARLVRTVSYGEERLLCKELTEACRAENRRAVVKFEP